MQYNEDVSEERKLAIQGVSGVQDVLSQSKKLDCKHAALFDCAKFRLYVVCPVNSYDDRIFLQWHVGDSNSGKS